MKRRTIEFMGIKLVVNEYVYEPSDDTELLAKAVIRNIKPFSKALEIGTGSGAIAILLAKLGCDVTATDINPKAIEVAKENATQNNVKIRFIVGDLFAGLNEKFDTIVFNPPYLPEDDFDFLLDHYDKMSVVGGKKGNETIIRFLKDLPRYLRPNGEAYIVLSSLSKPEEVFEIIRKQGLNYEILESKSFFFERIMVVKCFKQR
ncbi:MAG: methyltransferase [Crenarchaeota archaeon]|nr:methyltransferase [Thermoproteota archaeon]MCR8454143.1 methyltransferase [Thermoproteota archaeon]MCR8455523.1 methyltransferase [Thermoproteota archaeon]MCR8463210.1 methyltransferase [Thermoproteota archaeon]MCR8470859.1 methyltransferase [Thermoproteota archaeon]